LRRSFASSPLAAPMMAPASAPMPAPMLAFDVCCSPV
jgi:hypothetical protein